ncbi:ATP-binding cassette domain-containing protein [Gammaproteobacteria bacterium]|nr:ATP-binding cassette domain-containing protein [Gammaproteobacteria bacterium]
MTELLRVNDAICRLGLHKVLRIDELVVEQGQHWCFFGPNGAGKSVLASLLASKRIESGKYVQYAEGFQPSRDIHIVSFEEQQKLWQRDNRLDVSEYSADAEDSGTLVWELIQSSRSTLHADNVLFEQLVTELDLSALVERGIRFLSSGQIRKALIARALYGYRPGVAQLLILDDPMESIDLDSQVKIKICIEKFLHSGFSSIQLCRRARDILSGVNHIALLDGLRLLEKGKREVIENGAAFEKVKNKKPVLLDRLPQNQSLFDNYQIDSGKPLVELNSVNAAYGEHSVLENFSWIMHPGQHVVIEGPNGCGKSTLLSLIDGDNHKAYGQDVKLFGRKKGSGETIWEVKAKFGIVSNELHNKYSKGWKVLDVVVSGFFDSVGLYDDSGTQETDIAKSWLNALQILDLAKYFYHEISFGQQRLVLLARAMVKQPQILILDEPCVGLDEFHRILILDILDKIAEQFTTSILYVSHIEDEKPLCINRRLTFKRNATSGFQVEETVVEAVNP